MPGPERRIDDCIRQLCARAMAASDGDIEPALQELLELVHQKLEELKRRAARALLKGEHLQPERRNKDPLDATREPNQGSEST